MLIGILALQGAFAEHAAMLKKLKADSFEIRQAKDALRYMDGLILPGGESTVMGKLLHELDLFDSLGDLIRDGLPTLGTCAGLVLLAEKIANDDNIYFGSMRITATRNAYGRQLGSFTDKGAFGDMGQIPMVFIRAPYIQSVGRDVEILAQTKGRITAARQNNQVVCAFHPELTDNTTVHEYFLRLAG